VFWFLLVFFFFLKKTLSKKGKGMLKIASPRQVHKVWTPTVLSKSPEKKFGASEVEVELHAVAYGELLCGEALTQRAWGALEKLTGPDSPLWIRERAFLALVTQDGGVSDLFRAVRELKDGAVNVLVDAVILRAHLSGTFEVGLKEVDKDALLAARMELTGKVVWDGKVPAPSLSALTGKPELDVIADLCKGISGTEAEIDEFVSKGMEGQRFGLLARLVKQEGSQSLLHRMLVKHLPKLLVLFATVDFVERAQVDEVRCCVQEEESWWQERVDAQKLELVASLWFESSARAGAAGLVDKSIVFAAEFFKDSDPAVRRRAFHVCSNAVLGSASHTRVALKCKVAPSVATHLKAYCDQRANKRKSTWTLKHAIYCTLHCCQAVRSEAGVAFFRENVQSLLLDLMGNECLSCNLKQVMFRIVVTILRENPDFIQGWSQLTNVLNKEFAQNPRMAEEFFSGLRLSMVEDEILEEEGAWKVLTSCFLAMNAPSETLCVETTRFFRYLNLEMILLGRFEERFPWDAYPEVFQHVVGSTSIGRELGASYIFWFLGVRRSCIPSLVKRLELTGEETSSDEYNEEYEEEKAFDAELSLVNHCLEELCEAMRDASDRKIYNAANTDMERIIGVDGDLEELLELVKTRHDYLVSQCGREGLVRAKKLAWADPKAVVRTEKLSETIPASGVEEGESELDALDRLIEQFHHTGADGGSLWFHAGEYDSVCHMLMCEQEHIFDLAGRPTDFDTHGWYFFPACSRNAAVEHVEELRAKETPPTRPATSSPLKGSEEQKKEKKAGQKEKTLRLKKAREAKEERCDFDRGDGGIEDIAIADERTYAIAIISEPGFETQSTLPWWIVSDHLVGNMNELTRNNLIWVRSSTMEIPFVTEKEAQRKKIVEQVVTMGLILKSVFGSENYKEVLRIIASFIIPHCDWECRKSEATAPGKNVADGAWLTLVTQMRLGTDSRTSKVMKKVNRSEGQEDIGALQDLAAFIFGPMAKLSRRKKETFKFRRATELDHPEKTVQHQLVARTVDAVEYMRSKVVAVLILGKK
jgi:hypothetical protein